MTKRFLLIIMTFPLFNVSCNSKSGDQKAQMEATVNLKSVKDDFLDVTKVVDGDTFWVDDGTKKGMKVRLIGIDAPEARNYFQKKKEHYGVEAKAYLVKLLTNKSVRLEYDVDRYDQYKRTLAYAYLEDGTFINAELIKLGYAVVMTISPNVKYAYKFMKYQQGSRKNSRGIWGRGKISD